MMIAMCRGSRSGISSDCSSDSERCSSSDAVDFVMGGVYREALTLSNQPGPLHHASATLSSLPELCYKPSRRLVGAMRDAYPERQAVRRARAGRVLPGRLGGAACDHRDP